MSYAAAIMARLGLDWEGFRNDFAAASSHANAAGKSMGSGFHGAAEGSEHLLASSHRVARQIGNVAGELIHGGSAADVFAQGLEGVERSLHLPLGALAGLGIGALLVEGIHKAGEEAEKLHEELEKALRPRGGVQGYGMEELKKQLEEVQAVAAKLKAQGADPKGFVSGLGTLFGDFARDTFRLIDKGDIAGFGGGTASARDKGQAEAAEALEKAKERIAEKEGQAADLAEKKMHADERSAELAKIEAEFAEKRQAAATAGNPALLAQIEREHALAVEDANFKADAKEREFELERKLSDLKGKGGSQEVAMARLKIDAANESLQLARNEQEVKTATLALNAASLEMQKARTADRKEGYAESNALADTVGASDTFEAKDVALSLKLTAKKKEKADADLNGATSADKQRITAEIAQLEEQKSALEFSNSQKQYDRGLNEAAVQAARQQMTAGEKYNSIQDEIAKRKEHIAELEKDTSERAKDAVNAERNKVIALQEQTTQLKLQQSERSKGTLAELAKHAHNEEGREARQVERLEKRADRFRVRGHEEEAKDLYNQADKIRGGIGALKDSEKKTDFTAALDASQVLKKIETNTGKPIVNGGGK